MIRQALLSGQQGRMRLLYSAKTADDFAYLPELGEMATRPAGWRPGAPPARDARSAGHAGTAPAAASRHRQLAALIDDPATLCFVCGPETMVADVPRMLTELGIDRGRVRVEEW